MEKLKKTLLWLLTVTGAAFELMLVLGLFSEGGAGNLPFVIFLGAVLVFLLRALRRAGNPTAEAEKQAAEIIFGAKAAAGQIRAEADAYAEDARRAAEAAPRLEPASHTKPEAGVCEPSPAPKPPQAKSWLADLPEPEYIRRRRRREENKREGVACCPRCGSTSLSANKKGYSFAKAVLISPLGGTIGMNKIKVTCLNCGKTFRPGRRS